MIQKRLWEYFPLKTLLLQVLREQVENVPKHAAVSLIEFGIFAAFASDMSEFFILDIEDFTDEAACCADLADIVWVVSAFGADETNVFAHFLASLLTLDSLKDSIALFLRYLMLLQNWQIQKKSLSRRNLFNSD